MSRTTVLVCYERLVAFDGISFSMVEKTLHAAIQNKYKNLTLLSFCRPIFLPAHASLIFQDCL